MTEPKSPLQEASANSLAELFDRDPMGYSAQDLEAVVRELRRMRAKWEAEELAGNKRSGAGRAPTGLPATSIKDLEDLEL